ncbi:Receptor-type guanylate cyclase gcy-25 [Caenorhabditis elegans]|uniref:Isoform b of Receptor-type guanylate cyclase gcy-25 n=1 Tax=Caenorhabditis elegans TaxID=6239 RepID=A0A078BQP2-2|nr:Receptor-type guanylate cyclase gcy-25 [Caenorhabditis elegans]CDX47498.1 Receptor-type guanylate cyclase gcy-25 [Caenorhabditis elegans]|eukprot:NP_001294117.1 Receptor-type guanylate cyclase gcy-25 [Caenorhabditis elegans]
MLLLLLLLKISTFVDSFQIGHLEFENSNETRILEICMKNAGSWRDHRLISLPSCHNFNGLENAANLNYQYSVDLLIGAACDEETQTVSRLALRWHKLYLSSAPLSTKEKESTTIALKPHSLAGTAEVILAMCKSMKWKEIGIIYSEETKYTAHAIYDMLAEQEDDLKINVFLETDGLSNTYTILHSARALISFLTTLDLSKFFKTLKENAFRPLEFSIVHVDCNKSEISNFYTYLDNNAGEEPNPISAARLRKLYRHVALLKNSHDDMEKTEEFAKKYGLVPSYTLYKALILCDGLQLLNNYTAPRGNLSIVQQLPYLWNHVTNTETQGYSGPVFIGNDGVRLPYYEMHMWRDGKAVHVANVKPRESDYCGGNMTKNCYEFLPSSPLLEDLPPYTSDCGYDNNLCSDFHVFMIAAIVFSILLIPMAIAFYLQRKEHLIQQMPWRVPLDSISFDDNGGSLSASRRVSTISTARASYSSIFSGNVAEHAIVNKQKVSVKRHVQRRAITFSRQEMEMLNQLKYMSHTNINPFTGICFNQGSELIVMWQFTTRYSLEDLIFVKEQKFGRNFQSTFIKHIVHGINYIHNSSIKVHGALYLSNCVVDSYWVVKLTDFGIKGILKERTNHKELAPSSAFDVDAIHYKLAHLLSSQSTAPLHPKVPEGNSFTMRLLSIIQQCWLYKPAARPALIKITDAVNREFGQDVKGTLIDQMIEMIDEYSANLEQIVAERTRELEQDMSVTENLLYQLLPKSVADSIRSGKTVVPEQHSSVTLLVVDVCQFTKFCEAFIPVHILETLQELYSSFDNIVQKNKAFKVENVGDAYLICSGIPEMSGFRHLREICKISLKLQAFMKTFKVRHRPSHTLQIKMGITSGAVAAGILGSTAPRFCIFGDTVNMACRMASTGNPGSIQLSELTANTLMEKFPSFMLEERGMIDVKGKGACLTFWLTGEKDIMRRQSSRSSCISQIKFELDEADNSKKMFLNV